ncbi:MAG: hypothetical protein E6J03_08710 [Chloroflexi bacterium]|nr:MAG: hypothetical protein E6J03_08710 [Chloroflexota bacterium]
MTATGGLTDATQTAAGGTVDPGVGRGCGHHPGHPRHCGARLEHRAGPPDRRARVPARPLRPRRTDGGQETLQAILVVGLVLLPVLLPPASLLLPALAFGGFVAPSVVVSRRRAARRRRLLRELPDLVGLLTAFVGAGIPLEQALHLISARQASGPAPTLLAGELRAALGEYGLGTPIDAALEAMARRTGLVEIELVVAAIAQGRRQGAGLERILRDQQAVVRVAQRNRAAAEASRVGTRLVGVLVLVYLPEFMLLIMVPLFYGIFLRAFG